MNININTNSITPEVIISIVIGWIILMIILVIFFKAVKAGDNKKVLEKKFGKVIEKTNPQSTQVYWVTIDFEEGTRRKMRVFDKNVILSIGDEGVIEYQGQTIRKMIRENNFH